MGSLTSGILVIIFCLVLSAFFSATETALTSLSSLKAKHLRENSGRSGHILDLWLHSPQRVLAAVLIGGNLVNIFAAVYADNLVQKYFGVNAVELVSAIMTIIIVLFSEIIPKTFAKNYATKIAIPTLNIFRVFYWALFPLTWIISTIASLISSLWGNKNAKVMPQITEEELEFFINVGEEEGVIAEQKHEMLSGIFELGDTVVREIMVHRIDLTALAHTTKLSEAPAVFRETGLSRLPIYEDRIDNIIGILHIKDVMFSMNRHRDNPNFWESPVVEFKREAVFVPESKPVDQLFQELRKQRQHMAIVLDEYGGTSGLVTMEDIFEEIVGEVRDEFDNEEDAIRPTQIANQYLVECKVHIDDFCDFFDLEINTISDGNPASEYDTLGGLIIHHFGQIPKIGDKLTIHQVNLEVVEVSRRRVRRVLAKIINKKDEANSLPSDNSNSSNRSENIQQ